MKRSSIFIPAAGFKTLSPILLIGFVCLLTMAAKTNQMVQDVWKQLGITPEAANININVSVASGLLQYTGAKGAKHIAPADRVAVVNQLVGYAKKYTASPAFKNDYKHRQAIAKEEWLKRNPEPEGLTLTAASIKAEEKQRLEQQLKTAEGNLNSTNPKIKNSAPIAIENIKKQLAGLDEPDNAVIKRKLDQANRMATAAQQQRQQALQKFEAQYPEAVEVLLKKRLQEILDLTAEVDYAAELKDGYDGKKVFVNPVYERKRAEWKLAYRAGKEVTDAVRAAAQQWLAEL